jgi:hypothetical protein
VTIAYFQCEPSNTRLANSQLGEATFHSDHDFQTTPNLKCEQLPLHQEVE